TTAASLDPTNAAIAQSFAIYSRDYGIALYRNGDLSQAVAHLGKAAQLAPDDSAVHLHLGRALARLGRTEEASDALKLARGQNERARDLIRAKALNNEGNRLLQSGVLDGGLKKLEEAIALAPG